MPKSKVVGYAEDAFEKVLMSKEVTLKLVNTSPVLTGPLAHTTEKTWEMRGVVCKRPRGAERDFGCFGFFVANTPVPMRLVRVSGVISVDGVPVIHRSPDPKIRKWEVESSKGLSRYTVVEKNGHWSCTCPANSSFRKICRHINEMKEKSHEHP